MNRDIALVAVKSIVVHLNREVGRFGDSVRPSPKYVSAVSAKSLIDDSLVWGREQGLGFGFTELLGQEIAFDRQLVVGRLVIDSESALDRLPAILGGAAAGSELVLEIAVFCVNAKVRLIVDLSAEADCAPLLLVAAEARNQPALRVFCVL